MGISDNTVSAIIESAIAIREKWFRLILSKHQSPRDKRKEPKCGRAERIGSPLTWKHFVERDYGCSVQCERSPRGPPFLLFSIPLPSSSSHYCCQAPFAFTPRPLFLKTRGCLRGCWCVPEVKKGPHHTGASHARFMLANPDKPQEKARKRERGDAGRLFLNPPGLYRPCSLEF